MLLLTTTHVCISVAIVTSHLPLVSMVIVGQHNGTLATLVASVP